jgi:hypothetical protein
LSKHIAKRRIYDKIYDKLYFMIKKITSQAGEEPYCKDKYNNIAMINDKIYDKLYFMIKSISSCRGTTLHI